MADMLAWETRRRLFRGGEEWRTLPLLSRLVAKREGTGTALYEIGYRAENMAEVRRLDCSRGQRRTARPSVLAEILLNSAGEYCARYPDT